MRPRPRIPLAPLATVALAAVALGLAGCAEDDPGGSDSARAAVDAHVAAAERFDLAGTCELLSPERREEMAAFDDTDADGYCEEATADIVAAATAEMKAQARASYAGATIEPLDGTANPTYVITSADGSFREEVEVEEVDGRWWVAHVESDVDDHDHEEGEEGHAEDDHAEEPAGTEPAGTEPAGTAVGGG